MTTENQLLFFKIEILFQETFQMYIPLLGEADDTLRQSFKNQGLPAGGKNEKKVLNDNPPPPPPPKKKEVNFKNISNVENLLCKVVDNLRQCWKKSGLTW